MKENEVLKGMVKQQKEEEKNEASSEQSHIQTTNPAAVATGKSFSFPSSLSQSVSNLGRDDYRLLAAIQASQRSFCITNPALPDNPIVFASKGFLDLTGYRLDQVLGHNCRFLQGPGTDRRQVDALKKGIMSGVDTSVCLLNYRADGSTFYNQIFLAPLRDVSSRLVNYVAVQVEVR